MDYRDLIKKHEGFRSCVYLDSEGIPTVGWGHAFLGPNPPKVGTPFSKLDCQEFFEDDMQDIERCFLYFEEHALGVKLDFIRRAVIKNMLFNLGYHRLFGFKKMIAALRQEDYTKAAREMLDSKWATQVGSRATELALMMELGKGYRDA